LGIGLHYGLAIPVMLDTIKLQTEQRVAILVQLACIKIIQDRYLVLTAQQTHIIISQQVLISVPVWPAQLALTVLQGPLFAHATWATFIIQLPDLTTVYVILNNNDINNN
jgi:hypothetical protein